MIAFSRESIKLALDTPSIQTAVMCRFMGVTYKTYCERFRGNGWSFNQKCDLARLFYALTGEELNVLKVKK